jgi:anti-sigma-K factor RskA
MESDGIHELTAAYALSALDPDDERGYEEHLRHCAQCREELSSVQEAAAALAYAVDTPAPPARLRERILTQSRAERSNVVPLRRRFTLPSLAAAAAAAAGVAIGLGVWGSSLSGTLDDERDARSATEQVLALFAEPDASNFPVSGADGTLVVARNGQAGLVLTGLAEAPEGKTYEIWVIEGETPKPAGLFTGGGARSVVPLTLPVPAGATVAVTLEQAGGAELPTTDPFLLAPTV